MLIAALVAVASAATPETLTDGDYVLAADGKRVFMADTQGSIGVYDAKSFKRLEEWKGVVAPGDCSITPSRSGRWLAVSYRTGLAAVHDAKTGAKRVDLVAPLHISQVKISDADDKVFGLGSSTPKKGQNIRLSVLTWSLPSGKLEKSELLPASSLITRLQGSGGRIISGRKDGEPVSRPDIETVVRADGSSFELGRGFPKCLDWAGNVLVFHLGEVSVDRVAPLTWLDLSHPQTRRELAGVNACQFAYLNADGSRLLVDDGDNVTVWDLKNPTRPTQVGQPVSCKIPRVAPDLSFALCVGFGTPIRVELSP